MAAISFAVPLLVLSALHPFGSPAAASHRTTLDHAPHQVPAATRRASLKAAAPRGSAMVGSQSVPDGAGGHYVLWSDARDGDLDLFLMRVTSTGAPAAGWPGEGVVVCGAPGIQFESALFPDDANGVIVGWLDYREDAWTPDVFAQRVDASGVPQWAVNGIKLVEGTPDLVDVDGSPDGAGGVLVAWSVEPLSGGDIFALRITGAGAVATGWDPGGEIVCDDPDPQAAPRIVSDGAGGAVVAWLDQRNAEQHVYAQRLDASGTPQWTADGIPIDDPTHSAVYIGLCPAGGGHTFVFWETFGAVAGQRINGSGAAQWDPSGVALYPGGGEGMPAGDLAALPDGLGGAIVAWRSQGSSGNGGLHAQRVDGTGLIQWGPAASEIVSIPSNSPDQADFVPDGAGGAYFAWDVPGLDETAATTRTYAQRISSVGEAVWTAGGIEVAAGLEGQSGPRTALDGAGGLLVSWQDYRSLDLEIFTQRFNSAGTPQLGATGTASFTNPGEQVGPAVVQTVDGGALVVWSEKRGGEYDIRARKLDANGNPEGPATMICGSPGHQVLAAFIDDGAGGCIVAWQDLSGADADLYAQRIDGNAAALWSENGVAVCSATGIQGVPRLVSDGAGGAILAWQDDRLGSNSDIYAQRLDGAGVPQWATDGVAVCDESGAQYLPALASDGAGGAIVAWTETRGTAFFRIYAQRVDGSGAGQWTADGVSIAGPFPTGSFPIVSAAAPAPANGAVVLVREQTFDFVAYEFQHLLHAQKVDGAGAPQWGAAGALVCDPSSRVSHEQLLDDGVGGAFVAWSDDRAGVLDVFAQHVDAAGAATWTANGSAVCNAASYQYMGGMTRSGTDLFLAWADHRGGRSDVYAQRVDETGAGVWAADGVVVSDATRGQYGAGFAPWKTATPERLYVGWTDNRAGDVRHVYIERLDFAGVSQWTLDGVTDTEISLASAEVHADRVRLVWHSSEPVTATVYRSTEHDAWIVMGTAQTDGTGRIVFEDRDVGPGARYGYRLGILEGAGETLRGEVWVEVPAALELTIEGVRPNPAVGDAVVWLTLPRAAAARLEWLDLAGRRVRVQELAGLGAGRHAVRFEGAPPEPGVYLLRLTQGGRAATMRAVVIR